MFIYNCNNWSYTYLPGTIARAAGLREVTLGCLYGDLDEPTEYTGSMLDKEKLVLELLMLLDQLDLTKWLNQPLQLL